MHEIDVSVIKYLDQLAAFFSFSFFTYTFYFLWQLLLLLWEGEKGVGGWGASIKKLHEEKWTTCYYKDSISILVQMSILVTKYNFSKAEEQFYWYYNSAWVFFCKLAVYFQNSFSEECFVRKLSGILFFDLLIILLLFFIIWSLYDSSLWITSCWKSKETFSETGLWYSSKDLVIKKS